MPAWLLLLVLALLGARAQQQPGPEDHVVLFFPTYTLDSFSEHKQALQSLVALVGDSDWPALRMAYSAPENLEGLIKAEEQVQLNIHATSPEDGPVTIARPEVKSVAHLEGWNSVKVDGHVWVTTHSPHVCDGRRCVLFSSEEEQVKTAFAHCFLDLLALEMPVASIRFVFVTVLASEYPRYKRSIEAEIQARWPRDPPMVHIQEVGPSTSFNSGHRMAIWPFDLTVGGYRLQHPNYLTVSMET